MKNSWTSSRRNFLRGGAAVAGITIGASVFKRTWTALADEQYPSQPIDVIVQVAQGGGTDLATRAVSTTLEPALGTRLAFDYKPGAGGIIAWNTLWHRDPDGYALLAGVISTDMLTFALKPPEFKLGSDVTYLASINQDPTCITGMAQGPFQTIEAAIDAARKAPVNVGLSRWTQPANIALQAMNQEIGTQFVGVPYQGGSKARAALVQGELPLVAGPLGPVLGMGNDGKVLALLDDENRFAKQIGDVALINQATGMSLPPLSVQIGFGVRSDFMNLHPDRVEILTTGLRKAFADPEFPKAVAASGYAPETYNLWDSARCARYIESFQPVVDKYKDIMKEA